MRIDWEIYDKIRDYKRQGYSIKKISRILGIHRSTVAKQYKSSGVFPQGNVKVKNEN